MMLNYRLAHSLLLVTITLISCGGSGEFITSSNSSKVEVESIKAHFRVQSGSSYPDSLAPMFPNPFNRTIGDSVINIFFTLRDSGDVKVIIQNPLGDSVVVFEDKSLPAGSYPGSWEPINSAGEHLREGLYFITLRVSPNVNARNYINSRLFLIEAN